MPGLNAGLRGTGSNLHPTRELLSRWWSDHTDYSWLPRFLDVRGLTVPGRKLVAVWCFLFALIAATMQLSRFGSDTALARSVLAVGTISGIYAGCRWARNESWPTWQQSVAFLVWADLWLAVSLFFAVRTAFVGTIGCILFIMIGFYAAIVHSPRVAISHIGWALAVCTTLAAMAMSEPVNDNWVVANLYLMVAGVVFSTAWILQIVWLRLTDDARNAHRDYLTATLNRRGLQDEAQHLLRSDRTQALIALLIDVDSFKNLNDTHGHVAGDDALTAVADRLIAAAGPDAVVARIGGDEFVVLRGVDRGDIEQVATEIHSAVSSDSDPYPVSASTGVSVYLSRETDLPDRAVNDLIEHADNAMYRAKKRGGDRIAWVQMFRR
ncbi:GGDEF domain-containing protein [Rhodococcus sp. IEGM 1318]|uniref:GGDEF domain-containing protein n=1 Tax=Rhodococcus sp. IEGM 1318 TaxID=3082226 RepID=UPI00295558A2|nr:GGDEF domain-containing protein [Rhodococcus sp. IEGM 1318]MDV8006574.1 GGDEF domain-containing protein [Rhodococcus sp. IEGM 1318]